MNDPIIGEEMHKFQVQMAETDVKMYTDFAKTQGRSTRWENAFYVWFWFFGIFEGLLCIWYLVHLSIWAISSGALALCQVFLAKLNRRTRRNRLEGATDWAAKRDEALKRLEQLDPTNPLVPEIIEEEPYP